jgi:Rieske Fe-S protein
MPYTDVRLEDIEPGSFVVVEVRKQPYAVVRATPEMVRDLRTLTDQTWSRRELPAQGPEYFVVSFVSTNLGCSLAHAPKGKPHHHPDKPWVGGFYDSCHSGEWDYSGRALLRSPRNRDLSVPDYSEPSAGTLRFANDG